MQKTGEKSTSSYIRIRRMTIVQAVTEYMISILVAGSFLATLTGALGISDVTTGIISSFISLGCIFQLFACLIRRNVKAVTVVLSILNQLLFMLLFILPLTKLPSAVKETAFVVLIFVAYAVYYFIHPQKVNWLMSLIKQGERGRFTALKERVSLVIGMIFSYLAGAVVDHFKGTGHEKTAFLICAAAVLVLTGIHTASLVFTDENAPTNGHGTSVLQGVRGVLGDKAVWGIVPIFMMWNIAVYGATPFYGTYHIRELGFSLRFVTILSVCGCIVRILFSKMLGSYADKHSFAQMLKPCFAVMCVGFLCAAAATPSNGRVMFILYNMCHGFAMGGINSALVNLVFERVAPEKRANALALTQSLAGITGFATTLALSPLLSFVQGNGNILFGITVYAQQIMSLISFVFTALALIYICIFAAPKRVK